MARSTLHLPAIFGIMLLPGLLLLPSGCGGGGGGGGGSNPISVLALHNDAAGGDGWDEGLGIALDASGRILVTGRSENASSNPDMVIWRFLQDGTLDSSFGAGGVVVDDGAAGGSGSDVGNDIVVDPGGGVLVAGFSTNAAGNTDMVIWRYDASGSIDATFGTGGRVIHDGAAGGFLSDAAEAMDLDASGRIVVTGESASAAGDFDMVIWRYNADGTPDAAFGSGGVVVDAPGPGRDEGVDLAHDGAGRILVTGRSLNAGGDFDMVVWRFDTGGNPDAGFGGGRVIHDNAAGGSSNDQGNGLAVDSQGRILIAGFSGGPGGDPDMVIWRYNPTGTLDTSFGGVGWVVHHDAAGGDGTDQGHGIGVDTQAGILVAGRSDGPGPSWVDVVVWRYQPDGALEGLAHRNTGTGGRSTDLPYAMTRDPSGDLFITGVSIDPLGSPDMALWRYR